MKIADSFDFPKDLPTLCWRMADFIHDINLHFRPIKKEGSNDEDVQIVWSCLVQRLEELGIERPTGPAGHSAT